MKITNIKNAGQYLYKPADRLAQQVCLKENVKSVQLHCLLFLSQANQMTIF